jgi:hypothetical protein
MFTKFFSTKYVLTSKGRKFQTSALLSEKGLTSPATAQNEIVPSEKMQASWEAEIMRITVQGQSGQII